MIPDTDNCRRRYPAEDPFLFSILLLFLTIQLHQFTTADTPEIPNAQFEQGEQQPEGWSVDSGNGTWKDTGNNRGRVLAITGNGQGGVHWQSKPLDFEPGAVYELEFDARSTEAGGSSMISGPRFGNEDHDLPPEEWTTFRSIFVAPESSKPSWSRIRLGGWKLDGTILFDDVSLSRVRPLYNRRAGIQLGNGEILEGNRYRFHAPFHKKDGSHARPLARHSCRFHTNRWWFDPGSFVVYRHELNGIPQTSASVKITSQFRQTGKMLVESRTGPGPWNRLGSISEEGSYQFDIPSSSLPTETVHVRLRAPSGTPVSLQVHDYSFQATVKENETNLNGKTQFLKIIQERDPLQVQLKQKGPLALSERLQAVVTNHSDETVRARWSGVVSSSRDSGNRTEWSTEPRTFKPGEQTVSFPFQVAGPGQNTVVLRLGDFFKARMQFNVPSLYRSDYGNRLPEFGSDDVQLWWCKGGWKVSRRRPVPSEEGKPLTVQSARNEAESAQLVLHPEQSLKNVRLQVKPLQGPGSSTLSPEQIDLLRVDYVPVDQPTDQEGAVGAWPDPLPVIEDSFSVKQDHNQPIWLRVNVPKHQKPGMYRGKIHLRADEFEASVPIRVKVFHFALPDRMTLTTSFGFRPGTVWKYQNINKKSQRRQVLQKYWKTFSEHHISPYNPAPMADIEADWPDTDDPDRLDPEMNFSRWDRRMSHALNTYHFNSFRLSPPGLGGGNFHNRWQPSMLGYEEGTPQYRAAFNNYYRKLESHLRKKGWLDEAFIYWFDEPQPKDYDFVMNGFEKLKRAAPDLRRFLTEEVNDELVGGPNLWCPLLSRYDHEKARERRNHGDSFWWYICTAPKSPYAGLFIDRPATDLRVWLWQTWKRNIEGILIWNTNYWTSSAAYPDSLQNPYEDPMSWQSGYSADDGERNPWGNGDGRFLYPPKNAAEGDVEKPVLKGPVESIRWEMLRDGIEDYEYLAILQRQLSRKGQRLSERKHEQFTSLLSVPPRISKNRRQFTDDPRPIKKHRLRVAEAIEHLKNQDPSSKEQ